MSTAAMEGIYNPPPRSDRPNPGSAQNKARERGSVSHGSKDQEIENLKRLLAHISQRLDALKSR